MLESFMPFAVYFIKYWAYHGIEHSLR